MFRTGLTAAIMAVTLLGGCSDPNDVSYGAILGNLTPEMGGLASTPDDIRSHNAVVGNLNLRMASDDLVRMWLMDKPSILTPYPVYDSGTQP